MIITVIEFSRCSGQSLRLSTLIGKESQPNITALIEGKLKSVKDNSKEYSRRKESIVLWIL